MKIFFDFETTGLNPYHDKIIELGAIDQNGNKFLSLVNPGSGIKLSNKIVELTGINDTMLIGKPDIKTVLEDFLDFCGTHKKIYLIAHNCDAFDKIFLKENMKKYNILLPANFYFIDTMRLSQKLFPENKYHNLKALCNKFRHTNTDAHRAMGDATALYFIYCSMIQYLKKEYNIEKSNEVYNFLYNK
jgi:DNA polymerase III subunit alpha, Gram-positive type